MVLRETFMILIKYVQMQKTVATRLLFFAFILSAINNVV